jgi:hypothetical protein
VAGGRIQEHIIADDALHLAGLNLYKKTTLESSLVRKSDSSRRQAKSSQVESCNRDQVM